jgi:hypothetical protein
VATLDDHLFDQLRPEGLVVLVRPALGHEHQRPRDQWGTAISAPQRSAISVGSQSPSEMKNRGHSHEDPDGNNGERRGTKNSGKYLFLAPFSPSHIAPNISCLSLFH